MATENSPVELEVTIRSHYFIVTKATPRGRGVIDSFSRRFIQWAYVRKPGGRFAREAVKVYAASTRDRREYRFHINCLKAFNQHLAENWINDKMVVFREDPLYKPSVVELKVQPQWTPRDYQLPIIDYVVEPADYRSKLVPIQTGQGKTFSALYSFSKLASRILIVIKPMYIDKWVADLKKTYFIEPNEILVIQGSKDLIALTQLAEASMLDHVKAIIISNKTMLFWLKLYEADPDGLHYHGYAFPPEQLCEKLSVGVRLIDEVHQDFHFNYKLDLYTHVPLTLSLSATLVSDDDFMNKVYEIAYPGSNRFKGATYKKYVAVRNVVYRFKNPNKIRTKEYNSNNYSHHAFEKSIIRQPQVLDNYLKMIYRLIDSSYMQNYEPGEKGIVFVASIDLATRLTDYLKEKYPSLDIRRYVEDDPYDNLGEADLSVSTLLSAGTAVDIANLTTVLMTTVVTSSQANLQSIGRLRELPNGITPEFLYMSCEDIPKHMEYHERKKVLFHDKVLTHKSVYVGDPL